MDDDPGADAGAEDGGEHHLRPGRRAVGRFGHGQAIGVVLQPYGPAERAREIAIQRATDEPGGVGVLDQAGGRRDGAGNADADGAGGADRLLEFGDERGDGGDLSVIVAGGRGGALAIQLAPVGGERNDLQLSAAEVDADADRSRHLSPLAAARVPEDSAQRCDEHKRDSPAALQ